MNERLTNARLLDVWEAGRGRPPYQIAALLLRATLPPEESVALDGWTVGQRDAHLLRLREALFGDPMEGVAHCPNCGETVEFTLSARQLLLPAPDDPPTTHTLHDDAYHVDFRLPTLGDLAAVMALPDARNALLRRCVVAGDSAVLPPSVLDRLAAAIGEADPQAHIDLSLACPECGTAWQAPFDILHYLWREIDGWARRVLREIHVIAGAYGWSEGRILALTPARRRTYLELILGVT